MYVHEHPHENIVLLPPFQNKRYFGHKLCYKIKVTFGEISFKLCQTNRNVAINNVNVVELVGFQ
jgi:hypothetical protein